MPRPWSTNLKYGVLLVWLATLAASGTETMRPLALPGGKSGIGFDDLGFAPGLRKVLAPAGRSGNLDLIDPDTQQVTTISGFSSRSSFGGGHGQGVTSADEGGGFLFATDRDARRLNVVDPEAREIVAEASLASGPDYVRYVETTGEVWVTEPGSKRIEIFRLSDSKPPKPSHSAFIPIPGGPESLVIDKQRGRAYTHLWTETTLAIDLKTHSIAERWPNGCAGSRGIALDEARGFLFVGCDEGKLNVLDVASGKRLGSASSGNGVDIIAYSPKLAHAYLPGEDSATMAVIGISSAGEATVLGTVKTTRGAHCVAADDHGNAYVCDPEKGQLLVFKDPF